MATRIPHAARRRRYGHAGFTLLEVVVAITVVAILVTFVYQILQNSVRGQTIVREGLRVPKLQNAILGPFVEDLRYLYWDGFADDTGFIGKHHEVGGMDADSIHFVTARPSRGVGSEEDDRRNRIPSPITEVGYAVRRNEVESEYLEVWRREDWFVDDNPVRGGRYTLIYDKITTFHLQYFPIPEENVSGEGVDEWDTRVKGRLPYAIVLDIKFEVEDKEERDRRDREEEVERIRRIIVLKNAYNVARKTQQAPGQNQPN